MSQNVSIQCEDLDAVKAEVLGILEEAQKSLSGFRYGDIRLEVAEGSYAWAENGDPKASGRDFGLSLGVRVIAGSGMAASGHVGMVLGPADVPNLPATLRDALGHAHARARANADRKKAAAEKFGRAGGSLASFELAPIDVKQDDIAAVYEIDPRSIDPHRAAQLAVEVSKAVAGVGEAVRYNVIEAVTCLGRLLFASSEGALIDRSYAMTEGLAYIVAATEKGQQEHYDHLGHQRGWEVLEKGITDEPLLTMPNLHDFSVNLGRETVELCDAPPLPQSEKEVVVVTDPHYNTLLVHEIIGHPTELDRALKWETAYAGRTWLFHDLDHNRVGEQIASPLVSAYSDPSLPGYGHYEYDDEGTPAKRVYHIEKGEFKGFMNSRQTAAIIGAEPNGHYKATDASLVPLIRMSNTVFANGETPPEQLTGEVEHGYYFTSMRIPSIAESRENFRITARKVQEIKNGELGQIYRDGGITSDTRDFLMNVDGVGNDFRLYPIANCGKGQPMQTKKLGNGGPTLRSRARVTGK
ncbi:MAG: TldD/PmbA family protein [Planctomycetes bacterium]|nr:TldD/PmbA family protein [Planctomycetota bacterium]